ncbi:paraquat-inducible protein A [Chromobacterium piscinae]|uniref:Paraquat-inducible protein A n=1 Tax=Chromobacterium piscinae TaxID=686831 RepID=A0ABV0HAE6_9NEIS|nr:paraquat-inducible protein A [Chromobacterium piscinae]MBX9295824.1 paraquat-inducible protein A [Chromobacterium vaccinii]MBX9346794.1 paraquat-inducible protein A [Chromobacterium vaccinii]MBX9358225.1 paraquat-inducible protein A [Chromobacterium vaccinii]MCD5328426.1 paraquat-inducible protein A [Chromobacterium piscinae]NHQ82813.1 paraquat-inducible protein A [Chromobacterium vaccinii]
MDGVSGEGQLTACHDCDLLLRLPGAQAGRVRVCCPRCGAQLYECSDSGPEVGVALLAAGAVMFAISNIYPVLVLEIAGNRNAATLWQTALALHGQGMPEVALLVLFTGIVMPALELASMLYLQFPLLFGRALPGFPAMMRLRGLARPWCMVEVFLLGVLVSLVKLVHLASVQPGIGLWAFFGLIVLMAASASRFRPHELWERYRSCRIIH